MFTIFKKKTPEKLWYQTDMHCHVIPGIDDGSQSVEESVELISRMKEWGLSRILATPHVTAGTFENTPQTINPALDSLKEGLHKAGIDIDIDYSSEYRIDELLMKHIERGSLWPFPNDQLLIENSFLGEPPTIKELIFELQLKGIRPIMAHPERFSYYFETPGRIKDLHNAGAKMQVNILSLAGGYGSRQKKLAEAMIQEGLVDFLGTDLHNEKHAEIIEDYLSSSDYRRHRKALERLVRNDRAFV